MSYVSWRDAQTSWGQCAYQLQFWTLAHMIWHVALSTASTKVCIYPGHDGKINTQVLEAGKRAGSVPGPVIPGRNGYPPNPVVNLMYTSGSSGRPKGAEYTESMYCSFLQVVF